MTPGLLKQHEVAQRLGMTPQTFRDQRAALERRGFPPPHIETSYPRRRRDGRIVQVTRAQWSRKLVDDWLAQAAPAGSRDHALLQARQLDIELAARAAVIAARIGERRRKQACR